MIDDVGFSVTGLFDIEGAVLHAAEGRDLLNLGKFFEIGVVAVEIGLLEIVAPADDALNGASVSRAAVK